MRIRSLALRPYGHLQNMALEFPAPAAGPGLAVIYGHNGAGKSTTMRALSAALFGVPRRTPDTHTHLGPALAVGISLEAVDGSDRLDLIRRKRDRQSLFLADDTPADELALSARLSNLTETQFSAMFLLDTVKLAAGGQALLAGEGVLGEALLGASVGLEQVNAALGEIREEADALYLKGGQRHITKLIGELKEARQSYREQRVDPEAYRLQVEELAAAGAGVAELADRLRDARAELHRRQRQRRCLPLLAVERRLAAQIAELGELPPVPAGFVQELAENQQSASRSLAALRDLDREISEVTAALEAHPDPGAIVSCVGRIDALHQRSGEYNKAAADLPRRQQEREELRVRIESAAADAGVVIVGGPDDDPRLSAADRARLDELCELHVRLHESLNGARSALGAARRELAAHGPAPAPPAIAPETLSRLSDLIDAVAERGGVDARCGAARSREAELLERARGVMSASAFVPEDLDALLRLTMPDLSTLEAFRQRGQDLELRRRRLAERADELSRQGDDLSRRADRVAGGPRPPTREELDAVRERRDQVIRRLIDGEHAMADSVQACVTLADEQADRRADHAQAAAELEALARDRRRQDEALEELAQARAGLDADAAAFASDWQGRWAGLSAPAGDPAAMRTVIDERDQVRALLADAEAARREAETLAATIGSCRARLAALIPGGLDGVVDDSLEAALRHARAVRDRALAAQGALDEHARELVARQTQVDRRRDEVDDAERALDGIGADWEQLCARLHLPAHSSAAQVRAQSDAIGRLVVTIDGAMSLDERIEAISADLTRFEADARSLAAELAADLIDETPVRIAEQLHARAGRAREIVAARSELLPRHEALIAERARQVHSARTAQIRLEELAALAGLAVADLDALAGRLLARDELHAERVATQREIEAAAEMSVSELLDELDGAGQEELELLIAGHEDAVAALEQEHQRLSERSGELRMLLAGGGDGAAAIAERESALAAALAEQYDRFCELTLARQLLTDLVDEHRRTAEGPMLGRASELFARLSCGRMRALTVALVDDERVIMGVNADGREVEVRCMSDGQRDQLFLALRLASLEHHFSANEPMPLILDDLLINFDDHSARAALEILSELATRTQVLFFTHHDHLLQLVREVVPTGLLSEHEILDRPAAVLSLAA